MPRARSTGPARKPALVRGSRLRPRDAKDNVVDLLPRFKKELHERHLWALTEEDVERVAADIWVNKSSAAEGTTVNGSGQLMAEKAASLDAGIEISVNLRSALECGPEGEGGDWL